MAEIVENSQLNRLESVIVSIQEAGHIEVSPDVAFRAEDGSGVGIYALRDVLEGTPLVKVPFQSTLSVERIVAYEPLKAIFEENAGLASYPDEVLAIGLMHAMLPQGADCPWYDYVQTMPRCFNTPIYWEDEEVEQLRGTNVYHLTVMLKRTIAGDYQSIHGPLSEAYAALEGISMDLYSWALSVIYSRALDITRRGAHTRLLAPLLDMANHRYSSDAVAEDTFSYDDATDAVWFCAGYPMSAGQECFAVYGNYCNAKLLHTYGFVVPHNPHQAVDIWTKLQASSAFFEQKAALLAKHALSAAAHSYDFKGTIRNHNGPVDMRLLNMIRIIQADSEEELQGVAEMIFRGSMISVRNEMATYVSLRNLLSIRLNAEQAERERRQLGEMLLSDAAPSDRLLMALVVKVEERELVQNTISIVNDWIHDLGEQGDSFRPVGAKTV